MDYDAWSALQQIVGPLARCGHCDARAGHPDSPERAGNRPRPKCGYCGGTGWEVFPDPDRLIHGITSLYRDRAWLLRAAKVLLDTLADAEVLDAPAQLENLGVAVSLIEARGAAAGNVRLHLPAVVKDRGSHLTVDNGEGRRVLLLNMGGDFDFISPKMDAKTPDALEAWGRLLIDAAGAWRAALEAKKEGNPTHENQ